MQTIKTNCHGRYLYRATEEQKIKVTKGNKRQQSALFFENFKVKDERVFFPNGHSA